MIYVHLLASFGHCNLLCSSDKNPPCKAKTGAEVSEGKGCSAKCEGAVVRCVSFNWTGQTTDLGLSQKPAPKVLDQLRVYDQRTDKRDKRG